MLKVNWKHESQSMVWHWDLSEAVDWIKEEAGPRWLEKSRSSGRSRTTSGTVSVDACPSPCAWTGTDWERQ